jgi:hypothetical protein
MRTAEVRAPPLAVLLAVSRTAHLSGGFGPQHGGARNHCLQSLTFVTFVVQFEISSRNMVVMSACKRRNRGADEHEIGDIFAAELHHML